jgi:hypothetical protein
MPIEPARAKQESVPKFQSIHSTGEAKMQLKRINSLIMVGMMALAWSSTAWTDCNSDRSRCEMDCREYDKMNNMVGAEHAKTNAVFGAVGGMLSTSCNNDCSAQFNSCVGAENSARMRREEQQRAESEQRAKQQIEKRQQAQKQAVQQEQTSKEQQKAERWLAEGHELFKKKAYVEAIDFFESGLKRLPNDTEGLYGIAQCYLALKKPEEAKEYAARYLQLEPDSPYAKQLKRKLPGLEAAVMAQEREAAEALTQAGMLQKGNLMWMRCAMGQTWDGSTCTGTANEYTWDQAMALRPSFAGYSDWRVPTHEELLSIRYCSNGIDSLDDGSTRCSAGRVSPTINQMDFPNPPDRPFWSGSPVAANSDVAWSVDFSSGSGYWNLKYGNFPVRLVRGH